MGEEPKFKKASEYTPDEFALMTVNFQSYFQWLIDMAKSNAPEGQSISVKGAIGPHSAEITYSLPPAASYSRGRPRQKPTKKATLKAVQDIFAGDQGLVEITETDTEIRIRPTSFLGDRWKPLMQSLNAFEGAKWNKVEGKNTSYWSVTK